MIPEAAVGAAAKAVFLSGYPEGCSVTWDPKHIRVDDDLWDESQAVAAKNGDNLSAVIRDALRAYIEGSETQ